MRQLNTRRHNDIYEEQDMNNANEKIAMYHVKNMMPIDNNRVNYLTQ